MMSRLRKAQGVHTFSIGYRSTTREESDSDELEYARLAAKAFGTHHTEYRMGSAEIRDSLPRLVWHLDEPLADPTCIPLFYISRVARRQITVVLSGEGADETLAGYSVYQRMLKMERLHRRFGGLAALAQSAAERFIPNERYRAALHAVARPLEARYRGVSRAFLPELRRELLPWESLRQTSERLDTLWDSSFQAVKNAAPLDRMLYVDTRIWLPDDLLLKGDKMSMANSIELRVPFLDHKLVEFAATLPVSAKLQGSRGKVLLRRTMAGEIPPSILKRAKKGFPIPTRHWLKNDLRDLVHDALLAPSSAVKEYMNAAVVERIVREHEQGTINREHELWSLLIFEHWHRLFIDRSRWKNAEVEPALPQAEAV
jgi:asparagine synthase (glutamine-hydrolysing)